MGLRIDWTNDLLFSRMTGTPIYVGTEGSHFVGRVVSVSPAGSRTGTITLAAHQGRTRTVQLDDIVAVDRLGRNVDLDPSDSRVAT